MGSCSFHPDGNHSSFHPGRNYIWMPPLHPASAITPGCRHYIWLPPLSTRMYHIRNSAAADIPPRMFHIRNSDAGWERKAFQLPRSHISGSAYSAYSESFAAILCNSFAQCRNVLLKLPDMCNRHFEIFCFRYLMSVFS